MGALFIAAGACRRLTLASAALLEAWGRDLEAWHWLAARLAADEGGSRALTQPQRGGWGAALLPVCLHACAGEFFFAEWTFFITLCQPDISTHISISAAHSVSSHTDRASREPDDPRPAGLGACVYDPLAPVGHQWVVVSGEASPEVIGRWRAHRQYIGQLEALAAVA
eukprot:scaffold182_cov133-Isochrysis_galbana.AAC.1